MEKDAHYFWVGLFVTGFFVAFFGFLIWLMGTHGDTRDYDRYTVYFTDSISGLENGSSVQYQGIKVGKVIGTRLDDKQKDLVKVDIEIKNDTPISAGTKAFVAMQGVTGVGHLEVVTDPKDDKPPQRKDGEEYPVLQGTGSQWAKALEDMPVITQQIRNITAKLNSLLSPKAMQRLGKLLGG